jgi:hypothetical protein
MDFIIEHGHLIITILISLLLILCHFIFNYKKIFSPYNKIPKQMSKKQLPLTAKPQKIVVFDLDETLGCFIEVGIFWDALENYYGHNLFKDKLFEVLDVFQEFLRPNIFKILEFVKLQKENNLCDRVMIYTNNQGPKSWVKMISEYFNKKLEYELFDQIIAAFKVRNKIIEMCRTSHDKSVEDLIRCTKIPPNTEICFIDDQFHPLMEQDNVYYINVKPYIYTLPFEEMAERYFTKYLNATVPETKTDFITRIVADMKKYNFLARPKSDLEQNADKVVSKQLLIHLEKFFKKGRTKNTRKQKHQIKSRATRKRDMFI